MSGYLLDTHVWLWFLTGSPRLPSGLRRKIEESPDSCWLSPISVWEAGLLIATGRFAGDREGESWLTEVLRGFPLREAAITTPIALAAAYTRLPHRDPADAFLAATALGYGLSLMTVDRALTKLAWLPTISR